MTDTRPGAAPQNDGGNHDGEDRQTDALAPENENAEQQDGEAQAQTVTGEAITRATSVLGTDSRHVESSLGAPDAQDLVDHMKQMVRGNTVDMSAYAGEPNHDDNTDKFGRESKPDGLPSDGS